jgi:soluble lytic murein transglycosylase-like protein
MKFKFHYRAEVNEMAARFQLDPDLVMAVCLVESSGRTSAYRHEPQFWLRYMANKAQWANAIPERVSSSYGLMQVMYPVARELGMPEKDPPEFLFVPTIGLLYGCRKLRDVLGWAKGDVAAALAAYNGGKTGDNKPGVFPKRNQTYVNKVLAMLEQVRGQ